MIFDSFNSLYVLTHEKTPAIFYIKHSKHSTATTSRLIYFNTYKHTNISIYSTASHSSASQASHIYFSSLLLKTLYNILLILSASPYRTVQVPRQTSSVSHSISINDPAYKNRKPQTHPPTMGISNIGAGHRSKSSTTTNHHTGKPLTLHYILHHIIAPGIEQPQRPKRYRSWTPDQLSDANFLKVPASVWKNIHDPSRTEWMEAGEDSLTKTLAAGALLSTPNVGLCKV